jgi:transposase-like protein
VKSDSLKLDRVIREHCEIVLAAEEGHVRRAARVLGIAWTTLYRWIAEWKARDQKGKRTERAADPPATLEEKR